MSTRTVALMVAGLFLGVAAADFLLTGMLTPPESGSAVSGKPAIGGPFTLTDQTGKRVTEKDYAGRPMLVYFGYTNCPDICPAGLQIISQALDKLGPAADKITPVFITLDPERDTVKVLGDYVKSFHPRLVGLTGSDEEVDAAAKLYRVYHKKVEDETSKGRYSVDHTGYMYLMDAKGEYLQHFPHNVTVEKLAETITKHL